MVESPSDNPISEYLSRFLLLHLPENFYIFSRAEVSAFPHSTVPSLRHRGEDATNQLLVPGNAFSRGGFLSLMLQLRGDGIPLILPTSDFRSRSRLRLPICSSADRGPIMEMVTMHDSCGVEKCDPW